MQRKMDKSQPKQPERQILHENFRSLFKNETQPGTYERAQTRKYMYLTEIPYKQARIIFLIRHRINELNLKNNHKNQSKNDLSCPRSNSVIDN